MLRELFSSRLILAGLVILFVVAGACWFYSWHVQRTVDAELAKTDAMLHSPKNDGETRYAQDTVDTIMVDSEQAKKSLETGDTQMSDDTAVSSVDNASEMLDTADASLPDDMGSEEKVPADFPETPEGFPMTPLWDDDRFPNYQKGDMHDHEMIYRVLIKLWNQGDHDFINGYLDFNNGRVYPLYPDTIYVRWKEQVVGRPDNPRTIRVPRTIVGTDDRYFTPEELYFYGLEASYPEINFVKEHTAGYDPETFLTDDEK